MLLYFIQRNQAQRIKFVIQASSVRVKYILNATRGKFDYDLLSLLTVDDVQEKVQYHSACITNYSLKFSISIAFCLQKLQ
jgi:hypothetical protein